MTSYQPPSEDLAIFDPSVFSINDEPLTYAEAAKKFLKYPVAQGTETISSLNTGGVLEITPNSTLGVKILNTQTGSAANPPITGRTDFFNENTSGVEVNSAMIDYSGIHSNTLNTLNAVSSALSICPNSTRAAAVNIATGSDITSGCIVNIANGSGSSNAGLIRIGKNNLINIDNAANSGNGVVNIGQQSGCQVRIAAGTSQTGTAINIGDGNNQSGTIGIGSGGSSARDIFIASGNGTTNNTTHIGRGNAGSGGIGALQIANSSGATEIKLFPATTDGITSINAAASATGAINIGNGTGTTTQNINIGRGNIIQVVNGAGASTIAMNGATTFNQGIQINTATGILISGTDTGDGYTSVIKADAYKPTATIAGGQVGIGSLAGTTSQGISSIAIGSYAAQLNQGAGSVAIGENSGYEAQGVNSVSIGNLAANRVQRLNCVAIGTSAGQFSQGKLTTSDTGGCIAIGQSAGRGTALDTNFQQPFAVAIGTLAGESNQGKSGVALGSNSGRTNQGADAVAIGSSCGNSGQGAASIAIGLGAGQGNAVSPQGANSVAIGTLSGRQGQGIKSVAIGFQSAILNQGAGGVAIGEEAGETSQGASAISIGPFSGNVSQGAQGVAIGINSGQTSQGINSISIGTNSGQTSQGAAAIAIGDASGRTSQGAGAIAIGQNSGSGTGSGQGVNSIAIGNNAAPASQTGGSICLNASGVALNPAAAGFFVDPIRTTTATADTIATYNSTTKELTSTSVLTGFSYLQEVEDPMLLRVGKAGGIVGYTYDPAWCLNTPTAISADRTALAASYFYAGQVITSLGVGISSATNIAATSTMRIGLYTGAGALVASTNTLNNLTTFSTTTYNFFAVNSGTPYTILTSGFYYFAVGCATAATTATFNSCNIPNNNLVNYPNTAAITTGAISGLRMGLFTVSAGVILPTSLVGVSVINTGGVYLIAAI